ncbi:MAG: Trk system potassium transport protein TrkA [Legionellales bacterium RIFCSPHIGHO2_12_FULL_42_9]|nr:MAG: Trk system potassium transport protein TrkA [Legionellales bacterium RIFCSPHIGHO2_12_FULL_42_9]
MNIIILGAGQVGATLAKNLVEENNDVTLVDLDKDRLNELRNRLDIKTVYGLASHPSVLIDAGIERANMLIAVTNSDEINMMSCQIAYSLFNTPNKIARIRAQNYYDYPQLFSDKSMYIDVCISPEQLVTAHIENLIAYPGASQVLEFASGKLLITTIKAANDCSMIGKTVKHLEEHLQSIAFQTIAIFRDNKPIDINTDIKIIPGDDILFVSTSAAIRQALAYLVNDNQPNRRIIIAGGGHIGGRLAKALEDKYRIKVIEHNLAHATKLATILNKGTVLQGDIGDDKLLVNENIEYTDVFCAVSNDDEANIMAAIQAKRLGARQVMALVNRDAYVELIDYSVIDQSISPQFITIGSILTKLRGGDLVKVCRLKNEESEIIELEIHGDHNNSKVIGRYLNEIKLPQNCSIVAVVRGSKIHISAPKLKLEANDHVIVLLLNKKYAIQIEHLFQISSRWKNVMHAIGNSMRSVIEARS